MASQNDHGLLVDINVAIVGGKDTGKTALLEALCLGCIQNENDDPNLVHQVHFTMGAAVDMQPQQPPALLSALDGGASYGDKNPNDTRGSPKSLRSGSRTFTPSALLRSICRSFEQQPEPKRARLDGPETGPEKVRRSAPTLQTKISVVEEEAIDPKHRFVPRRTFQVETDEVLLEIKRGTRLTFFDIPGLSFGKGKYTKTSSLNSFVQDKWPSFDCVVIVTSARDGRGTEESKTLLHFFKGLVSSHKDVPILIVANRVDDCDDHEREPILKEQAESIRSVFGGVTTLHDLEHYPAHPDTSFPAFIPMSAKLAFFYRAASLATIDDFRGWRAMDLVNKIGAMELGRKEWGALSNEKKMEEVHKMLTGYQKLKVYLENTNFDKFGPVLQAFLGHDATSQAQVLSKKMKQETSSLKFIPGGVIDQMRSISARYALLDLPADDLKEKYWSMIETQMELRTERFRSSMDVESLHQLMKELVLYSEFSDQMDWPQEQRKIEEEMMNIVGRYFECIIEYSNRFKVPNWKTNLRRFGRGSDKDDWRTLSPMDWVRILDCILLNQERLWNDGPFVHELLILKQTVRVFQEYSRCCSTLRCNMLPCPEPTHNNLLSSWKVVCGSNGYKENLGDFVYHPVVQTEQGIRKWGSIIRLYCSFMDKKKTQKAS